MRYFSLGPNFIFFFQEVLSEFNTVFYGDTSLNFVQKEPLNKFLQYIEQGVISPFQMPSETSYSSKFATLKGMKWHILNGLILKAIFWTKSYFFSNFATLGFYRYIPDYTYSLFPTTSHTEEEASFIIAQRSEYTRRLLKWLVLDA